MKTFITCDTWRPVRTAVFISSQFCNEKQVQVELYRIEVKTTNLWDWQHRLNVILLNLQFSHQLLTRLFVWLNYFSRHVFCLWSIVNIAHRPNNPCTVPVFLGIVSNFKKPWENFNNSVKQIKVEMKNLIATWQTLSLLISVDVILLSCGAVWVLILSKSCYTSDCMLWVFLFNRNIPFVWWCQSSQDSHATLHSCSEKMVNQTMSIKSIC